MKIRVERANWQWSVNDFMAQVRKSSVDLSGALETVVESLTRLSEDASDMAKAKFSLVCKQMTLLLDMEYAGAVERIGESVV